MRNKTVKQKGGNYTELNEDMKSVIQWGNFYEYENCNIKINELKKKQEKQGSFHKKFGYSFKTMYDTNSSEQLRNLIYSVLKDVIFCLNLNNNKELLESLSRTIFLFKDEKLRNDLNTHFEVFKDGQKYEKNNVTYDWGIDPGDVSTNNGGTKKSRKSRKSRK